MAKYRKKPIIVEAEQFWPNVKPWPEGVMQSDLGPDREPDYWIATMKGKGACLVKPGYWIITDPQGERDPCMPDNFAETYESVDGCVEAPD